MGWKWKLSNYIMGRKENSNEKLSLRERIERKIQMSIQWLKKIWKWSQEKKVSLYKEKIRKNLFFFLFFFFLVTFLRFSSLKRAADILWGSKLLGKHTSCSLIDLFCYSSQNHRGIEIEKHLWRSSIPTSCSGQGLAQQGCAQAGSEYFQGWRLHHLYW